MRPILPAFLVLALSGIPLSAPAETAKPSPKIDPAARAIVDSVTARLAPARTVCLTAKHKLDPSLGTGGKLDQGPLRITVQRPNQFHVLQEAGQMTREIAFDGKTFCLMQPEVKLHGIEPLKASSIDEFADKADDRFGFRPPVAELLGCDVSATLFKGADSARVVGSEIIGWTRCQQVQVLQKGMTTDLWVGTKDHLPHRMLITFSDLPGQPKWDIRLSDWKLDVPVDAALFAKRPAADSFQVKMLRTP